MEHKIFDNSGNSGKEGALRHKREELYKHRKNLVGKNISHLPSVEDGNEKIFINESLTSYRKRLFGRIREYKRNNNLKYLVKVFSFSTVI